jgi:amidophosphoribosyltransferase
LFALQHRGQEAAGIAVSDGKRARVHKEAGLVANVFTPEALAPLTGYHTIGHTRYSTTGSNAERNIQPFLVETMHGPLAVAHNGNLVNAPALRDELLNRGFGLTATSDSEVMTLMLAAAGGQTWEERIERTLPAWKGAFSLVMLAADHVIAVRDPWGFRPLSVGRLPHGGHAVASRDLRAVHPRVRRHRRGEPGEMVTLKRRRGPPTQVLAPQPTQCSVHVRVRLLLAARLGVGRPQRPPRPPAARAPARPGGTGRCRRGDPGARLVDPRGDRLLQRERASRSTTG